MKRIFLIGFGLVLAATSVFGQSRPYISNIDKISGPAGETVAISGINFPTNIANVQVNFGSGKGTVTSATANLIEATVPASATFGVVSVTNLSNGLIGYSSEFFMPSFGGNTFESTAVNAAEKFDPSQNGMYDLCVCDFDGDGRNDVATSQRATEATRVPVFHNNSDINALAFTNIISTNLTIDIGSFNVTCGDLDGDGKSELVALRSEAGATAGDIIFVFRNTSTVSNISFGAPLVLTLPTAASGARKNVARASIIDLDGDGKAEIIATNEADNQIDVFKNNSTTGTVSFQTQVLSFTIGSDRSFGLDVKDLNNDGFPEIIANAPQQADIYILPNNSNPGTIAFGTSITVSLPGNLVNLIVGDLNGDGLNDIAATQFFTHQVSVILNQTSTAGGTISFGAASSFTVSNGPWGIDLGDLNGDGKLDILVSSTQANTLTALINTSAGSLNFSRTNLPAGEITRNVKIADVNEDGKPDLLATGITNSNLVVFANRNCLTPTLSPANPQVCEGSDLRINAVKSAGHTYTWETGPDADNLTNVKSGAEAFLDLNNLAAGTLLVKVTATSNENTAACSTSATTQLTVAGTPPAPPTIPAQDPICQGATLEIDGTLPTPSDAKSYEWTGPNSFSSTNAVLSIADIQPSQAGTYSLRYVSQSDCVSPAINVKIEVQSLPAVSVRYAGNGLFCEDATVVLTTPSYSGYNYQWFRDNLDVSGETATSFTASTTGLYAVRITDPNTNCSDLTGNLSLSRMAKPVTSFTSADAICVDVPIDFTATSTVGAGASALTLNYAWDVQNDGTTDQTTASVSQTYTTAATTTVRLTTGYTEISGCTTTLTKDIEVRALPVVPIETPDGVEKCPENSVTLQVPAGSVSYSWNTAETTNAIEAPTPGTYTVTIVDDAQCTIVSTVDITDYDTNNTITLTSNDAVIDEEATTQFTVTGATQILSWDPTTGIDDPTSATPVVTGTYVPEDFPNLDPVSGHRLYTYTVTALDGNGCQVSASVDLAVIPEETPAPMRSFSPNGDGVDDFWTIDNAEFNQECKLVIFDRRGRAILETRPYNNDWDGTFNGNQMEQGVYYYVFICDDAARNSNGSILLFR